MRLITVGVALSAVLVACGSDDEKSGPTVKIGAVISETGISADGTYSSAVNLARDQMNSALEHESFHSIHFSTVVADDQSDPTVAVQQAVAVAGQGVKGIVAGASQPVTEIMKTFYNADTTDDLNVPIASGSATAGSINNPTNNDPDPDTKAANRDAAGWHFRIHMAGKLINKVAVRYLLDQGNHGDLNGDNVFRITNYVTDDSFGTAANNDFIAAATALADPGVPVHIETILLPRDADVDSHDFASDIDRVFDLQNETSGTGDVPVDAVIVAVVGQFNTPVARTYAQSSYNGRSLLFTQSFRTGSVLTSLGDLANGLGGVSPVLTDGQSGDNFARSFVSAYGESVQFRDAIFYDATAMLMLATMVASKDLDDPTTVAGADVRDAMLTLDDPNGDVILSGADEFQRAIADIKAGTPINYAGASGPVDFDANRSVLDNVAQFVVQGGAYVDIKRFACVASPDCLPVD